MENMFSGNTEKKIPKNLKDCYMTDKVSHNLWIWCERLEKLGEILYDKLLNVVVDNDNVEINNSIFSVFETATSRTSESQSLSTAIAPITASSKSAFTLGSFETSFLISLLPKNRYSEP